ncbi:MAG: hypothetical protein KDD61_03015 [Bdellovibrionales bacterium]|nr:hypothetical protein [Bdellovibrionales bacterium]
MKLIRATQDDEPLLTEFFEQSILPGQIELRLKRPQGFFKQYEMQSKDFVTYMLLDKKDEICALATIVFRQGWIHGEPQTIGYATDLRVSPTRSAVLHWSQHFLPALEQERAIHNCKYVFSVVARGQRQAFNAFIRPRSPKRQMPRYYSFRSFQAIMLHGLYPLASPPLKTIETRKAREMDREALCDYIFRKKQIKPYYFANSPEMVSQQIDAWPNLKLEDFWVAFDYQSNVVGCLAPWHSKETQQWVPAAFHRKGKSLQESLQLASYLRLAHRFGQLHQPLDFFFLTHLFADNPDIFYSLLWHAFKETTINQFLTYTHFEKDLMTTPPRGFIHSGAGANLYSILSPNEPPPELLRPTFHRTQPDFELAFI